jgi:hypothetical protein
MQWTIAFELAFRKLKKVYLDAPIPQHFDPAKEIVLQTIASGFAIADIFNQFNGL